MIKEVLEPKTKRAGKRVICICDNCGKEFESKYSEQTRRGKTQHFCSWECYKKGHIATDKQIEASRLKLINYNKKHGHKNLYAWKGGKYLGSRGYMFVYSPDHPFQNSQKYVLEHRLVMEKYLGRYLRPKEVVHHINGIKDDNRIENLMLFETTNQHGKYHASITKSWGTHRELQLA